MYISCIKNVKSKCIFNVCLENQLTFLSPIVALVSVQLITNICSVANYRLIYFNDNLTVKLDILRAARTILRAARVATQDA